MEIREIRTKNSPIGADPIRDVAMENKIRDMKRARQQRPL